MEAVNTVKEKLGVYFRERAKAFLFQCQRERFELGESCSAYFFRQVRAARFRAYIPRLHGKEGISVADPGEMLGIASVFFGEILGRGKRVGSDWDIFWGR